MSDPDAVSVNCPASKLALPGTPTAPMSSSTHGLGSPGSVVEVVDVVVVDVSVVLVDVSVVVVVTSVVDVAVDDVVVVVEVAIVVLVDVALEVVVLELDVVVGLAVVVVVVVAAPGHGYASDPRACAASTTIVASASRL